MWPCIVSNSLSLYVEACIMVAHIQPMCFDCDLTAKNSTRNNPVSVLSFTRRA